MGKGAGKERGRRQVFRDGGFERAADGPVSSRHRSSIQGSGCKHLAGSLPQPLRVSPPSCVSSPWVTPSPLHLGPTTTCSCVPLQLAPDEIQLLLCPLLHCTPPTKPTTVCPQTLRPSSPLHLGDPQPPAPKPCPHPCSWRLARSSYCCVPSSAAPRHLTINRLPPNQTLCPPPAVGA